MKEAYVNFRVAEMLKKKGFNWKCITVYITTEEKPVPHILDTISDYNSGEVKDCISCPTQQMTCRWMREEKGIHICSVPDLSSEQFYVSIAVNVNGKWRLHANFPAPLLDEKYIKCEDAVEAALEYVLTNLI